MMSQASFGLRWMVTSLRLWNSWRMWRIVLALPQNAAGRVECGGGLAQFERHDRFGVGIEEVGESVHHSRGSARHPYACH